MAQAPGQQSSGLGRKSLCDTLGTCAGATNEEVLHHQSCGATEKERSFPLEIWQHHLCGRAASGTRRTQPTGPRLSGLGFLHVVIQCLNDPPEMNNLGLLMFTVQNCYHILSKVVVKRGTRSVRFTKPQAYRGRKYLDLKKKKTNHLYNCFALHCLNGKGK